MHAANPEKTEPTGSNPEAPAYQPTRPRRPDAMTANDQHIAHLELAHAIMTRVQELTRECITCGDHMLADDDATAERIARAAWTECEDLRQRAKALPMDEPFQPTFTQLQELNDYARDWIEMASVSQSKREMRAGRASAMADTTRNLF